MPTYELDALMQRRDGQGNDNILYPVTRVENVIDLTPEAIGAAETIHAHSEYALAEHTHPAALPNVFSADFDGLTNVIINDGVFNWDGRRIEAGGG